MSRLGGLSLFLSSCDIHPCPFLDHSALVFTSSIPDAIPRGPGRWHPNISILDDPDFIMLISDFWSCWQGRKLSFSSISVWWDLGKRKVKGLSINYCKEKSRERHSSRCLLINLASHLKLRIDSGVVSCIEVYHNVLAQISSLDSIVAKGSQVHSTIRWAEEGEISSSFFFRLEKKHGSESWISAIRNSDDVVFSKMDEICSVWRSFYLGLFSAEETDAVTATGLLDNLDSFLTLKQAASCYGPLSVAEVLTALNGMSRNKTPGSDGLPVEFYIKFWHVIDSDLTEVFNNAYDSESLSKSQKLGLITLLFKKGDRLSCKNWRPITLLNVDYKLCARTIAGRLLKVLQFVVAPDQTCGVPGRFIGENVAFLRDVVSYVSEADLSVAILSLDQEKAFDRVDWSFLLSTLSKMGFGASFRKWIKLFYTGIRSSIIVNGYTTKPFCPSRGVRQGCPLSPLLYILTMEVLAVCVCKNPAIVGFSIPGVPDLPVLSLYADDTSVVVSTGAAITAVFETYDLFERASGAKINLDKCEGLWLGSWRFRLGAPVSIH